MQTNNQLRQKIKKLQKENKALMETLVVYSDKKLMKDILRGIKEIRAGKGKPLSEL